MASSKRNKVNEENSCFENVFTVRFMLILPVLHYKTKHRSFEQSNPLISKLRVRRISELYAQYDRCTQLITQTFTAQQHANKCSLQVVYIGSQSLRSFYPKIH